VLDGLPNVPLTPEENSVGTGRSSESESVESNSLTTGGGDSLSGRVGESESGDRELGALGQSLVVEDGTDGNDGLVTGWVGVLGLLDDSGEGERGSVDLQISAVSLMVDAVALTLLIKSRLRMTRLNRDSVLRARNR